MSRADLQTVPVSERHEALWEMPSIASQMPLLFANGTEWEKLEGFCNACGAPYPPANFRGSITRMLPNVAMIEAVGICRPCKCLTQFVYRLHDDLRVTGPSEHGWSEWRIRPSAWKRVVASTSVWLDRLGMRRSKR